MLTIEKKNALSESASGSFAPRFLRPHRAAQYLGISRSYLYELLAAGSLKSHRLGSARLIDRAELDRLVAAH